MISKPMLAATLDPSDEIPFPVFCSQKLDGIRCLVVNGEAVSRNFKPIKNAHIRRLISKLPEGFDGEIMAGKNFQEATHAVMSEDGEPEFTYAVFDWLRGNSDIPYIERMDELERVNTPDFVKKILPVRIEDETELLALEKAFLRQGYEGVMLRKGNGPYKFGRSTVREGYLVKLKRFIDSEAEVLDCVEQMENTNEKIDNALGHGERSSAKAGMVPKGTLGAFKVRDIKSGIEFSIGSGMNDAIRAEVWKSRKAYIGKIIKYKSQPTGVKTAPRFPVFLGFRARADMDVEA
jgi:DNA ligase-1